MARGEIPSTYIVFVHLLCVNAQNWFQLYEENVKFFFFFIGWRLQGLHCYRFFEVQHSWERAADLCKRWVPIYLFFGIFFCTSISTGEPKISSSSIACFFHDTHQPSIPHAARWKISRPRFSMQTFVVSVAVVKDSPRLLFFCSILNHKWKASIFRDSITLTNFTHTFAYFSIFYLFICLLFFFLVPNREQCQVNLFIISVRGRTEPQQSLKWTR